MPAPRYWDTVHLVEHARELEAEIKRLKHQACLIECVNDLYADLVFKQAQRIEELESQVAIQPTLSLDLGDLLMDDPRGDTDTRIARRHECAS